VPISAHRDPRLRSLASVLISKERETQALLSQQYFRTSETASALSVNISTVRAWLAKGLIPGATRTGVSGRWRIPASFLASQSKLKGDQ
jgi:DNA-binding CsgD family transcriptional regulator